MGKIIKNGITYSGSIQVEKTLTRAEYDALPASKLTDNITYFISDGSSVTGEASSIHYDNSETQLTGTNVQDALDEATLRVSAIEHTLSTLLTGTITAGDTSVTITDSSILTTSIIDIYFQDKLLAPTAVTVSEGSIVVEIDAQDTDTVVGVRVL